MSDRGVYQRSGDQYVMGRHRFGYELRATIIADGAFFFTCRWSCSCGDLETMGHSGRDLFGVVTESLKNWQYHAQRRRGMFWRDRHPPVPRRDDDKPQDTKPEGD